MKANPFPSLHRRTKEERNARIIRLHEEGLKSPVIAARMGISSRMVLTVIQRHRLSLADKAGGK